MAYKIENKLFNNQKLKAMKTLVLTTVLSMLMAFSAFSSPEGFTAANGTTVRIFQTNPESVDVYVSKAPGELVKILVCSESGNTLLKTRVKKQSARYIRYHLSDLPAGSYRVKVEKSGEILSDYSFSH